MPNARRSSLTGLLVAMTALAPARAADPQPYSVTIEGAQSSEVEAALKASAQLVTLNGKRGLPPFALIERARGDVARLKTALESFGYYASKVSVAIGGRELDDSTLPEWLDAAPAETSVPVKVTIAQGPLYHLGAIVLDGEVPESDRRALGLASGDPAIAANVLDARQRLLTALQEDSFALAAVDPPIAYADDEKRLLGIEFKVRAGGRVDIGAISFKGLKTVDESFARRVVRLKPGERFKPSRIDAARQALMDEGVFSGVSVHAADRLSEDGRIPVEFDVQERPRHAVAISGAYSTDLGVSVSTTWSHRNLFGGAEQLNLTAAGTGLGNATAGIGYNLRAQFIKPAFLEPEQALEFDLTAVKQNLDAYSQTAEGLAGFLRRKFSDLWSASAGLSWAHDDVLQESQTYDYQLIGLPLAVAYDSTGIADQLRDPVGGVRASMAVTPTQSIGPGALGFVVLQASASAYFDLGGDGRSVLALRTLAGSIIGGSNLDVPPDQRLYAGGSATVRGYAYQSIGPQFADGAPVGAKSVDAASVEFRQRLFEDWGAAVFLDAGQASADGAPFTGELRFGAGAGLRYYTPIGPVRLDAAIPLTRGQTDAAFEIYIGLGQAF
ncbi:MAG TPA: BamA/TamA family outer membrane protein [Rhizomicrobium sp.]|nr:BamA/TamA family outer membrane protein [Rhizomicrobium sp.]